MRRKEEFEGEKMRERDGKRHPGPSSRARNFGFESYVLIFFRAHPSFFEAYAHTGISRTGRLGFGEILLAGLFIVQKGKGSISMHTIGSAKETRRDTNSTTAVAPQILAQSPGTHLGRLLFQPSNFRGMRIHISPVKQPKTVLK